MGFLRTVKNTKVSLLILLFLFVLLAGMPGCAEKAELVVEEGEAHVNGTTLYYKKVGTGQPVVVLHGGPGLDHSYFLPQLSTLAREYQLIYYDQRGTGRSSDVIDSSAITVRQFVEDLEALRRHWQIERMNLMGHSWGAQLAYFYAMKYPDNLASLVLLNPAGASSDYYAPMFGTIAQRLTPADTLARFEVLTSEAYRNREPEAVQKMYRLAFKAYFFNQTYVDSLSLSVTPATARNGMTIALGLFRELMNFDVHGQLGAITCPTLVLHGDYDPIPASAAENIHRAVQGSEFLLLKNSGHFPFVETKDEFFTAVRSFLRKVVNR